MRALDFLRSVVGICLTAALLAGCGGSQPPIGAPGVTSQAPAVRARPNVTYEVLYSFGAHSDDGAYPRAGLINVKGKLYGTTIGGGANCIPSGGCGTVYAIEHFGGEKVIHSFGASSGDGSEPYATLIPVGGRLYGTTYDGGANGDGTVFAVNPSGRETVLYSFKGSPAGDGANPYASLISVKGRLYGTTYFGGANHNQGTAFAIGPYGGETVIYSFYAYSDDGTQPIAGLVNVKGRLYGTTYFGGADDNGGTFFTLTQSGKEAVRYSFAGKTDGANPYAALVNVKGTLYGTTEHGGGSGCYYGGCGTVFAIGPYGGETVIHSFGGSGDGKYPHAGLVYINGTLYGTTTNGGANCIQNGGCGTVFSIKLSGKETETVLHSFGGGSGDGVTPYAGLLNINGTLYGTTAGGGANDKGTVFSLKPWLSR